MKDLMFFGAGASFGSEPSARVPPLGGDLFDELARFACLTWGRLSPPWPERFRNDFEEAMAAFIAQGGFGAPLQWDMAEYFFTQFAASSESAYVALLRGLRDRLDELTFATLNYEMMLFQARHLASIPMDRLDVCLPHGNACVCCVGVQMSGSVTFTGGVSTGGSIRVFEGLDDFLREKRTNVLPPVMSYFEPNKFTVSCSNFIEAERLRFHEIAAGARRVAIVGVRVHPVDRHIWEPLAASDARIMYVGGTRGAQEFEQWATEHGRSDDSAPPMYFREAIPDLVSFLTD